MPDTHLDKLLDAQGNLPGIDPPTPPVLTPTLAKKRLLDAAEEIYGSEPEDLKYLHVVFAQCGLPYRQLPPDLPFYERRNGRIKLVMTRGVLDDPKTFRTTLQGYPYGAKPRLLLIHLCTEAKLTNSPEIDVGNCLSAFMQDLGLAVTGGKTGSLGRFKEQLNRLAATRMQILFRNDDKSSMKNPASPISQYDIWFPRNPDQKILWRSSITLSQEFFDSLVDKNALPLDPRAIKGLQRSAMALDVYVWLAHRLFRIPHAQPATISWFALRQQFGPDYGEMRKFRQDFKTALAKVQSVYRDAKVSFDRNGILQLRQSRPPVAKAPLKGR